MSGKLFGRSRLVHPAEVPAMNDDGDDDDSIRFKGGLKVALISGLFVVGSIAMILLLLLRPEHESRDEYGVVFDAGSSHTALYVYKWAGDQRLSGTAVPVDQVYYDQTKPGISFFTDNPSDAGSSLEKLLKGALKKVPRNIQSSTPVYLGATAGMRLIRKVNRTLSVQIMSSVRKTLSESGFQFTNTNAEIITGKDEGSSGWITVNYLKKVLQTSDKHEASAGALDLGGASTQITFVSRNVSQAEHLHLYGHDYPLYTQTYLCYGANEIYRRFLAELAKSFNYTSDVPNPCAHKGFNFTKNASYLWDAACSCQPSSPVNHSFNFYGSLNLTECSQQVTRLFTFNNTCPKAKIFSRGNQPPLRGNFVAFSGYYYIANNLHLSSSPTMGEFRSAYESACSKPVHKLPKVESFLADDKTICFAGQYVYSLLTQGYGFDNRTWKISFQKNVDKKELGWTLGYMINATNLIPKNKPKSKRLRDEILIPALVLCAVFILVSLLLCVKFIRRKRPGQNNYIVI